MYIDVKRRALALLSAIQSAESLERYYNMAVTDAAKKQYLERLQVVRRELYTQVNELVDPAGALESMENNLVGVIAQGDAELNPPLDPAQPDVKTGQSDTPPPSGPEATAPKKGKRK